MAVEATAKALLVAVTDDPSAAVYSINKLKPEFLCFFLSPAAKASLETAVQPHIAQMPRRWDCIVTDQPDRFMPSYQTLARSLHDLLTTWDIKAGELVVDMTGATPAMSASLVLASLPFCSRVVTVAHPGPAEDGEVVTVNGDTRRWLQGNPWDEAAAAARREACGLFNAGSFRAAATVFRHVEARVSGGQKPLYRGFADLADGYAAWERLQHRQAWEKLKTAHKALEMASMWGGPSGLKAVLPSVKQNAAFLEKLVLDPAEVKEAMVYDLLSYARRRTEVDHHVEAGIVALLRALEAFAQYRLFKYHRIKTLDVRPEQLPHELQDTCRACFLDDVDGKYKLPMLAQFRTLAGFGDASGHTYLAQWPKMKPLLDAAYGGVLGHGFDSVKPERFHQLFDIIVKVLGMPDTALPKFPALTF